MPTVSTEIEITAPPAVVRSTFLDWKGYKTWHTGVFTFTTLDENKQPGDLVAGDKIHIDISGTAFNPEILENNASAFRWKGSLLGLFVGEHQFYFKESDKTPAGTTLVQKEDFSGLLSFLQRPGWKFAIQTQGNFEKLNQDIKAAAEKRAGS